MNDRARAREASGDADDSGASLLPPMSRGTVPLPDTTAAASVSGDRPAAATRSLARGALVGRYLVLSLLGRGGMGEVYAAYDPELDRRVALKLLHALRASGSARARLVREARALGRLSHPNVVQVHDVGEHEGDVFIAMELVEGESLDAWCEGYPRPEWQAVLAAYLDAARGLSAAHEKGLVHRDVKPSNILRGKDGRVRVVDFGLAAGDAAESEGDDPGGTDLGGLLALESPDEAPLTAADALLGTPLYMAPEQHRSPRATPASDQYSFCASLYEGLHGAPPFTVKRGATPAEARAELLEQKEAGPPPSPPPGSPVPAWIHRALVRGMAFAPGDRYPSLPALVAALGDDPDARRRTSRRKAGVAAVAAALVALGAAGWARSGAFRDPCAHPEQQLAGAWDDAVRARVRAAFVATGRPYAEDTATRVSALLDRQGSEWAAMRGEVCEASKRIGQRHLLALRDLCLERRRGQLQALTTLFAEKPDPEVMDRAAQAASRLYPVSTCADVEALAAPVRPPEDPALRARVEALQPQIDRVEALHAAGRYRDGLALIDPMLAEAEAIPYPPLRAQVQYWMGRVREDGTPDYPRAKALLRDAAVSAAEGHDDDLAAAALTHLLVVVGDRQSRFDDAGRPPRPGRHGPGPRARRADPCQLGQHRGRRLHSYGQVPRGQGRPRARPGHPAKGPRPRPLRRGQLLQQPGPGPARAGRLPGRPRRARARRRHQGEGPRPRPPPGGPEPQQPGPGLLGDGRLPARRGDPRARPGHPREVPRPRPPRRRPVAQQPLPPCSPPRVTSPAAWPPRSGPSPSARRATGRTHPFVAISLNNLAELLSNNGELSRALALHRRALAIREKALGPDHADLAVSLTNIGNLLLATGDLAGATASHERALAIWEKALGPDHPNVAYGLTGLGRARIRLGQLDAALPLLERALALRDKAHQGSQPEIAEVLLGLGELRLARKKPDEAVPLLERALALADAERRNEVQLTLADALWQVGKDRERARSLAEKARASYEHAGHRPGMDRATRWLADPGHRT